MENDTYLIYFEVDEINIKAKILFLNPIQDRGAKKPPTSFSPITPANVRISPQNFLTFILNPFVTLV